MQCSSHTCQSKETHENRFQACRACVENQELTFPSLYCGKPCQGEKEITLKDITNSSLRYSCNKKPFVNNIHPFTEYDWYMRHREFHVEFKKAHPKKTQNFKNSTNRFK